MSPGGPGAGEPRTEGPGPIPSPVLHPLFHPTGAPGAATSPAGCRGSAPPRPGPERRGNPLDARCPALAAAPLPATRGCVVCVDVHAGVACNPSVRGPLGRRLPVAGVCGSGVFGCNALLADQGLGWQTAARQQAGCPSCPLELPTAVLGGVQGEGLPREMQYDLGGGEAGGACLALRDGVGRLPLLLQVPGLLAPSSHNGPLVSTPRRGFPWLQLAQPKEASYDLPGRAASSSSLWLQPCGGGGDIIWRGQLLCCEGSLRAGRLAQG